MMAHKQLLHELLQQDQEPFQLKTYIADKRSQLNHSNNRHHVAGETSTKTTNVCFFSFNYSPDVGKSPIIDFNSPAVSARKSPGGAVPSKTAAALVEAAMRIKNQQHSKVKTRIENARLQLFGPFLKIVKHWSKNKALRNNFEVKEKGELKVDIRISCSCDGNRSEESDEINGEFALQESRFCSSPVRPFRFSLCRSPSSTSGRRTTECCSSPTSTPVRRHVKQKEKNATGEGSGNVNGVEEEKDQCSPVSVLDPFFEDEGHESVDAEEDEYDLNCSYANLERTKQQLLNRLRRFEELAALDPFELELNFLEGSDDELRRETVESDDDEDQWSLRRRQGVNTSCPLYNPRIMATDEKRLVDLKVKENGKITASRSKEEVGVVYRMMVELDLKREIEGWERLFEEMEQMAIDVEVAIFRVLVEELSNDLFNSVLTECS